MKKIIYWFMLTVAVLVIAMFAGMAIWFCVYRRFFYIPPTGPVLPESVGPDAGGAICLLIASTVVVRRALWEVRTDDPL